jgi:hypothetical protein
MKSTSQCLLSFHHSKGYRYCTASLNALAGLNFGVNLAAILIDSPVFRFLPFRAFLLKKIKATGTI